MIFENRYGRLDRILHRVAFRAGTAQRAMADVEDILYRHQLRSISLRDPVFITALPRSGTTILLNLLAETGQFATHTYRDMPFILCPMLWSKFSERFAIDDTARERAHGDGILVSGKSPEAFEEMIWKHFWPKHYERSRILPWSSSDTNPEFDEFFEHHMRKVVAIRGHDSSRPLRYLSKNNVNIARLASPPLPLRSGVFLIPFREPLQHAASMLHQHRRFLEIHAEDAFVWRYMEAIGHHEFGMGLRPVDYGGWVGGAPDPGELGFWLGYWIAAYRHVLEHFGSSTILVSYARLIEQPRGGLSRLADAVGIQAGPLVSLSDRLRSPRTHEVDEGVVPSRSLMEAAQLYQQLESAASV